MEYDVATNAVTTPRRYLTTGIAEEDEPRIAVAGSGFVIVYLSDESGARQVHWMRVDGSGVIQAGPLQISTGAAASRPSIAVGGAARDRALVT